MRFAKVFVALAATTMMLIGCASQKEPAEKAVAQIESSVAEFRADAEKYAADELKNVDESITKLKNSLASKDYSMVVKAAPSLASTVASLKQTVAAKKADADAMIAAATAEWGEISAKVPQMVEAIQSRVDILGKSKKLPKNVSQEAFDSAKSGLESMKSLWTEASGAFTSGDAVNAVDKARGVKAKGEEVNEIGRASCRERVCELV